MTRHHKKTLNYLKYKCGFNLQQAHSIIARYGAYIGKPKPKNTQTRYYNEVCDHIQGKWDHFMKFYITIKDSYPVRKFLNLPMEKARDSYNDIYSAQENGDFGELAYNGVTEDF